jgi:beta-phosphoglucomutase
MLKAVLFDLDGVVTDSAKYHYLAWKEIADELRIPFDKIYNEKLKGVSRMDSLELILKNENKQDAFTKDQKEKLVARKNTIYKELIQKITPEDTLPGIRELLYDLKANKIKTCVCSASKNAFFIIDKLKLNSSFDHIIDAVKVKNSKPDSDIFAIGAYVLDTRPEEAVGIEDAKAGIEAIKKAGIKAVGVGSKDEMKGADLILASTAELSLEKLRRLLL